jgi:hypothetical protein
VVAVKTILEWFSEVLKHHRRFVTIAAGAIILIVGGGSTGYAENIWGQHSGRLQSANQQTASRSVVINSVLLDEATLTALEQLQHTPIPNGRYWYDRVCGAWGIEGGPARGFVVAGLNLGGPLRADASRGRTGVFINGRELHALDVAALRRLGPVRLGRYWLDALGNVGNEGGPALVNLVQVARAASSGTARHVSRSRKGSAFTTWDRTGVAVFGW